MSLPPGTRLGSYEILAPIGAGGMGAVYRARDTRLNRDVAIKVLPELSAANADSVARFEREAQTLAALNHPNIAIIHGFEESAGVSGQPPIRALVLELVDGPTLAERIGQGRLPLDEALPIARQIAEGCEAAHAQGIVHRDLKPANIKVRPDGTVKILDFGIAKLVDPIGGGGSAPAGDDVTRQPARTRAPRSEVTSAPTLATPAMTMAGMILGTAAYMAPEQARGRAVDKRADLWAFGCVLFEMLTGRRAFGGEDVTDTLAFVITREPDWTALPPGMPRGLLRLLRRCLAKDPHDRLRDMGDARLEILDAIVEPLGDVVAATPTRPLWTGGRLAAVAIALAAAAALGAAIVGSQMRPAVPRVYRFDVSPTSAGGMLFSAVDRDVAIAPDGNHIAYIGPAGTISLRAMDRLEPSALAVSGTPRSPFFSPDGRSIGFVDGPAIKRVPIAGGTPTVVCRISAGLRGAAWLADDTIVFATSEVGSGLRSVPAGGGEPKVLIQPSQERGEGSYVWPEALPGKRAVLFTIASATTPSVENSRIGVLDLATRTQKIVLNGGSDAHYVPGGYLVFGAAAALRAVRFDLGRLEAIGNPVVALPQANITQFGALNADTSNDGALLYVPGSAQTVSRTLVWVDRDGHEAATKVPARTVVYARLSPDGSQAALDLRDQENDIWIWNFGRETLTRLTLDPATDRFPVWSADGRRIFFGSDRGNAAGLANIFWQAVDGTGMVERLTTSGTLQVPMTVSPDGQTLVFRESRSSFDLMALSLDAERKTRPLVQSPVGELNAEISPDGRWMAYESNDSGQFEVFVRPFPDVDRGRWQISTMGGIQPLWSRTGQELFYLVPGGGLMSVRVERAASWSASAPAKVFDEHYYHSGGVTGAGRTYDVSADGRRFLMIKPAEAAGGAPGLVVVQNWRQEIERLMSVR